MALESARLRGVSVRVEDGRLIAGPRSMITGQMDRAFRECKAEIIERLEWLNTELAQIPPNVRGVPWAMWERRQLRAQFEAALREAQAAQEAA